jgi:UDP-N-acetyl-D-mannosaminuronic acid dehydrogenase
MPTNSPPPLKPRSIAIVGGCGHVGLPLGLSLADVGWDVTLVDTGEERVRMVQQGQMPFLEENAAPVLKRVLEAGRLHATTDNTLNTFEIVIVTIGTPVDEYLDPMLRSFDLFMRGLLDRMRPGQLVILRSTLFPGVTERLGRTIAAEERGIDLAYCPERIAQGMAISELRVLPQLVSATSPQALARARSVFETLGAKILELDPRDAELAKLFSNAYRYINFAISNQFYMIAKRLGADFDRVYSAVTQDYPRMRGFAKAGFAAGPCLYKDTMQLAAFNHFSFPLGQAAMVINEGLPAFLVDQLKQTRKLSRETVGILGMAFKGNSDDPRSSLAYKLRKILLLEAKQVVCTDPYIHDSEFLPLDAVIESSDVLILAAPHDEYRYLKTDKHIVDVFGFIKEKP